MLRDCVVIAIEGTHASGKTTLTHAWPPITGSTASTSPPLRNQPGTARSSRKSSSTARARFDLETEVDLFAAQLSAQLRAARQHTMVICRQDHRQRHGLRLARAGDAAAQPQPPSPGRHGTFCEPGHGTYDAVLYCCDRFGQHQQGDPYRAKVLDLQTAADRVVRSTCATTGQRSSTSRPT